MKHFIILTSLGLSLLLTSCGGYEASASGTPISNLQTNTIHVVCDRKLDDQEVHNAVKNELINSGFKIIDLQDNSNTKVDGTVLHYMDVWGWDMVALIRALDIRIVDGKTNSTISQAHYKQLGLPYPDVDVVVKSLFTEMRAKGTLP